MPYKFPSILGTTRINIDEAGATLLTPATGVYGTLGAYIQISFAITASGMGHDQNPETVFDRTFSFRWKYYTQQSSATPSLSSNGFRVKTGTAIAAAVPMEFFASNGVLAETNQNYEATLEVVSATVVAIVFRFYCTSEDPNYTPYFSNNINRLLASVNKGAYMELEAGSQFNLGNTGISIVATVSDFPEFSPPPPPYVSVTRGTTGASKEYWTPILMKWPGRNSGNTDYHLFLDEMDVTTFNGDVLAAKAHKDTALAHQRKYDDNFDVTASKLSSFEDNFFRFNFDKGAIVSFTATAVRAFLLRTDDITNEQHFLLDYHASIASIPASDTTQLNISGDIYNPASFTNGADYEVKFRVPGSALTYGATYRAIVILYGTTSGEIYSGISHELTADSHPNFYPKLDAFWADYFKESVQPGGIAAYHSAFRARFELHKRSVTDAFEYYGISGDWNNIQYVRGDVIKPGTESETTLTPETGTQPFLWVRGSGLLSGDDFTNTNDYMFGSFKSYIDEELLPYSAELEADYYVTVQWEVGVESSLPSGEAILLKCQYQQKIVARRWESEVGQPVTPPFALEMDLYRANAITIIPPGTKFVCGATEVLALVEKFDVLRAAGLDAFAIPETYAETNTNGNTVNANIKQRRSAFNGFIPAATNPVINAYDSLFSLNAVMGTNIDDSGVRIDIQELGLLQKFWFVMLARPDNPDGAPFIATTPTVTMVRDGSSMTTVTADFTAWRVAFDALLTGADTPIDFRINNFVTQSFSGLTAGGSGNPSGNADVCEVTIDHKKTPIKRVEVVYEIEGTITVSGDPHLVRFMVRGDMALPTAAGTIVVNINPTDWQVMDYDY